MDLSIFDVIGPVMVGPSSSHTAGAAKLAYTAAQIAGGGFKKVSFGLHGSFAKTGEGHGTKTALLAGSLGIREDDERMKSAYEEAELQGRQYNFYETELENCHENTVVITFEYEDGTQRIIQGSSIGGGRIVITGIDGTETDISAEYPTLMLTHRDIPGMISEISRQLSEYKINIGIMKVSRKAKGHTATTIIETDSPVSDEVTAGLSEINGIINICVINPA